LSTGAIVAFSWCATGSVKGFDEVYPRLLELVTEKRLYELVGLGDTEGKRFGRGGIAVAKRLLNSLHREMVIGKFEEGHIHQENDVSQPSCHITHIFVTSRRCSILSCTVCSQVHSEVTCWWRTQPILLPGARKTVASVRLSRIRCLKCLQRLG
jgi:hypothetical protein